MVRELERLRGVGIGTLTNRIVAREFFADDLTEVIRLALVGGGTSPQEAKALIDAYAISRPIFESHALTLEILNALWSGKPEKEPTDDVDE